MLILYIETAYLVESGEGFTRPWVFSSHKPFANSLPMDDITFMSSIGQSSKSSDLTRDRCVPRFRCIPEHSIHMSAPRFKLAQSGSVETANKPMELTHFKASYILTLIHYGRCPKKILCQNLR